MHVLVTGANRGIGLEICRLFVERGHTVTGTVREPASAGPLRETGAAVETLDVQKDASVAALATRWGERPLDVLVNNAGVGSWAPLEHATTDEFLRVFDINALGPLRVTRALLPALKATRGRIFHITSRMGSIGDNPSGGAYAYRMSKAALNMASTNLAGELRPTGVASIVLHPGWVQTDMGGRNAPLTVAESGRSLASLIERTGFEATGQFLNYDGQAIPW